MNVRISRDSFERMTAHARECYPDECCGMVVERGGREQVVRVSNIQNEMHAKDPEQFPRTARTAYTMGPDAAPVLLAAERGELHLLAFYHSHPEHDAYFSAEDRKQAFGGWEEPTYPQARQIVISVYGGEVKDTAAFAWDSQRRDYVRVPLTVS